VHLSRQNGNERELQLWPLNDRHIIGHSWNVGLQTAFIALRSGLAHNLLWDTDHLLKIHADVK
jgi:hypothetical protein